MKHWKQWDKTTYRYQLVQDFWTINSSDYLFVRQIAGPGFGGGGSSWWNTCLKKSITTCCPRIIPDSKISKWCNRINGWAIVPTLRILGPSNGGVGTCIAGVRVLKIGTFEGSGYLGYNSTTWFFRAFWGDSLSKPPPFGVTNRRELVAIICPEWLLPIHFLSPKNRSYFTLMVGNSFSMDLM